MTALTGTSLPAFKSTLVFDFSDEPPALDFVDGCIRRWNCGLTINVGKVEFPPEVLAVSVPSTYYSPKLWIQKEVWVPGKYMCTYPCQI